MRSFRKTTLIFALFLSLLTACADKNGESSLQSDISQGGQSNSASTETSPHTSEAGAETESDDTNTDEPEQSDAINYSPTERLLYNGEIYGYLVGSRVTEVDGKLYELDTDEVMDPFIDAESMKESCEYIGKSTPISIDLLPQQELEYASYSDAPVELYKIDENQILVYSTEEYDVPEEFSQTMFYPGKYRIYLILVKNVDPDIQEQLLAKYYRYAERFPE